ncbi:MAG TPA: 1-(5-phosphoribosyl)-5-[(5-phosphoribosylamino)methylideneamino] imidazole-4-carboxamide isomerase [Gemmatimonadales bacterium]|nr:1-(5-phosphoribosyl)-5-[(5-phosphoribosylamino)methylideneamino] imidazole-4-carboxamide isomerase [Gemmatimonadales bacterium]
MDLYPAIDIRHGRVVRLVKGDAAHETRYEADPIAQAERFAQQGARWIHLVDLDLAFGDGDNTELIGRIARRVGDHVRLQLGGGFRSAESLARAEALAVHRIVIGTAVVDHPELVGLALERLGPERVAVGIDARGGFVATRGWIQGSAMLPRTLAERVGAEGVRTIIYTDIDRDGMLTGPDVVGAVALQEASGAAVIASGGVSSLDDLVRVQACALGGAIIGRALYEGRFTFPEALSALLSL